MGASEAAALAAHMYGTALSIKTKNDFPIWEIHKAQLWIQTDCLLLKS